MLQEHKRIPSSRIFGLTLEGEDLSIREEEEEEEEAEDKAIKFAPQLKSENVLGRGRGHLEIEAVLS